jgi:ABC-2 type transport system ATP-binding protein
VRCDTPQRIRETLEGEVIEVQSADWQAALKLVGGLPGVREVQTYGESLHVLVDDGQKRLPGIERALKEAHIDLRGIRVAPARMEEAFISLIHKMEAG